MELLWGMYAPHLHCCFSKAWQTAARQTLCYWVFAQICDSLAFCRDRPCASTHALSHCLYFPSIIHVLTMPPSQNPLWHDLIVKIGAVRGSESNLSVSIATSFSVADEVWVLQAYWPFLHLLVSFTAEAQHPVLLLPLLLLLIPNKQSCISQRKALQTPGV